jgi:Mg2+-importing ATPase
VLRAALLNARLQTGLVSPLDAAIVDAAAHQGIDLAGASKLGEIPYDFERKRLGVVARAGDASPQLIVKGAFEHLLAACSRVAAAVPPAVVKDEGQSTNGHHGDWQRPADNQATVRSPFVFGRSSEASDRAHASSIETSIPLGPAERAELERRFGEWSAAGLRVLGLAARPIEPRAEYCPADERDLTLLGFLLFCDPPKPDAARAIGELAALGVQIKLITGDNRHVAMHTAQAVGLPAASVLSGAELSALSDEALWQRAERTSLFVDVDPNQKERIILALRKTGHVVGYMGDGINDAPALHAADVGISVDTAVDVAKDAADFVLLEQDLGVLRRGIEQGRSTFANTLKYVFTTTSANFGNMLSMAGASLFLPFLPLLAKQILLNNFLSDLPGAAIASDNVDREWVERPQRWDIGFIRRFMAVFGLLSSLFDYLTFGALWLLTRGDAALFRTGWFVESLLTELAVALVVRTRQPCYRSRPGRLLWASTLAVALATLALPYLPSDRLFGFTPLPAPIMALLIAITGLYVLAAELTKRWFYMRFA